MSEETSPGKSTVNKGISRIDIAQHQDREEKLKLRKKVVIFDSGETAKFSARIEEKDLSIPQELEELLSPAPKLDLAALVAMPDEEAEAMLSLIHI